MSKRDLVKICLNMNRNVLEYVDKFAEDNGITRTTAMTLLLTQALVKLGYGRENED